MASDPTYATVTYEIEDDVQYANTDNPLQISRVATFHNEDSYNAWLEAMDNAAYNSTVTDVQFH